MLCPPNAPLLRHRFALPLFCLLAACGGGGGGGNGPASTPPRISVGDADTPEGDQGTVNLSFPVTLSSTSATDVTVTYATSDLGALSGVDYVTTMGTLVFPAGTDTAIVEVPVLSDASIERDESLVLSLSNASSNAVLDDDEAFGTIRNDDFPQVFLEPVTALEGDVGTRTMTLPLLLDAPALEDVLVSFHTEDETAIAGQDYEAASGDILVPAGSTSVGVGVDLLGDTLEEATRTFWLVLDDVQGPARLGDPDRVLGGILDDDGPPSRPQLDFDSPAVSEGDSGTTTLSFAYLLSQPLLQDLSFTYSTADGTASALDDYDATSGTHTIAAGVTSGAIDVLVHGDTLEEPDETIVFYVDAPSSDVALTTPRLRGHILDDDGTSNPVLPALRLANAEIVEGNSGMTALSFRASLSQPAAALVEATWETEDDTALAGADYVAASGTLTIPAGALEAFLEVEVLGDTVTEDDETFRVVLSSVSGPVDLVDGVGVGTITTDEPLARVSVDGDSAGEGDSGTRELVFRVRLSPPTVAPVTMDFATKDGTAIANEDYTPNSGSLTIPAGATEATVSVDAIADSKVELDEQFTLCLSNLSPNAIFTNDTATGSILNDDATSGWQTPALVTSLARVPFVVRGGPGGSQAAAIWTAGSRIEASVFRGGVWEAPLEIGPFSGLRSQPRIALDANGMAQAAYSSGSGIEVNAFDGTAWGTLERIVDDPDHEHVRMKGNAAGDVAAVWSVRDLSQTGIDHTWRARRGAGASAWDAAERLDASDTTGSYTPQVHVDGSGNVLTVWKDFRPSPNGIAHYFRTYDAATDTWSSVQEIPGTDFTTDAALAGNAAGKAVLVIGVPGLGSTPDSLEALLFEPVSKSWSSTGAVEMEPVQDAFRVQAAMDANGNAAACWVQHDGNFIYNAWANHFDAASGSWGDATLLELDDVGAVSPYAFPRVGMIDASGAAVVVWGQPVNGVVRMRASRFDPTSASWGAPGLIGDGLGDVREPWIASGTDGVTVVWNHTNGAGLSANRYLE